MQFVGRKKELEALEDAYSDAGCSFIPIYGRRRVGKSELIKKFIGDKAAIYFLGKQAPAKLQIKEFLQAGAKSLQQPLLAQAMADDWQTAISLVVSQASPDRKLILVMDEFQWSAETSKELPSVLQGFIDNNWGGKTRIFLILCGSYMGFMEKKVLGEKSPLFGRRTGQILLKPFSYLEAAEFHSNWSVTDKAKVFSICGGIPYYLKFFLPNSSIDTNIRKNFLNEFSALAREPEFLLREELKELKKYFGILTALATGATTNQKIEKITGIEAKTLFYYLNSLKELGYIASYHPLTSHKPNPKQVHYKLKDPLLRFWFCFIYPNNTAIAQMEDAVSFNSLLKPHLEQYFGYCYEILCRDALAFLYQKEELGCSFEIGAFWSKDVQIDIVGQRKDGVVDIGECKWGAKQSLKQLGKELERKIVLYPNHDNKTIQRRLFLRSEYKIPDQYPVQVFSLADLYSLR